MYPGFSTQAGMYPGFSTQAGMYPGFSKEGGAQTIMSHSAMRGSGVVTRGQFFWKIDLIWCILVISSTYISIKMGEFCWVNNLFCFLIFVKYCYLYAIRMKALAY